MELLFESRREVENGVQGKLRAVQGRAEVLPEPVLQPDSFVDGTGASIYGTVLRDGGRYRMWYQAWPKDWTGRDVAQVGYAESDDGLTWRKPELGLVEHGPGKNNLCNLGFHSPSVFIDPTASPERRYRATGFAAHGSMGVIDGLKDGGYHVAYSADGLRWTLESERPRWPEGDVITSVWHEGRGEPLVAFKRSPRVGGIQRRAIWTDTFHEGTLHPGTPALIPDEYDDVVASTRGCSGADYYGMGMQPAGLGCVGFLWHFRHHLPRTPGSMAGVFGVVDVGLTFQGAAGHPWRHFHGRPDFISHDTHPWMAGGVYTANRPTDCGDEHRLYFCGATRTHAWYLSDQWQLLDNRKAQLIESGLARVGVARWPAWRLFGLQADPEGAFTIDLGRIDRPSRVRLNYECETGGSIRAEIAGEDACSFDESTPLAGHSLGATLRWGERDVIAPGDAVKVNLRLDRATAWAWDVTSV